MPEKFIAIVITLLLSLLFFTLLAGVLTFVTRNAKKRSMAAIAIFSLFLSGLCFIATYGPIFAVVIVMSANEHVIHR